MASALEQRFIRFLEGLEGAENLDRLLSGHARRADFLLGDRSVIVEIKSLETDPEHKIQGRLQEHERRPDYPVFYWPAELSEVLGRLPDGEEIRAQIFHALTRSIQGAFEKADDQIAATRAALHLDDACGVLVLLNKSLGVLAPEMIAAKVSQMMRKRQGGAFRYSEVSYAWIISESHCMPLSNGTLGLPMVLLEGPSADRHADTGELLETLLQRWAEFGNVPLIHLGERETLEGLHFNRRDDAQKAEPQPMKNHELWRAQYRATPYLSALSKEEFLRHAAALIAAMTPHFLIGGRKLPEEEVRALMVRWTHALEEAERRRLDMKELTPYVDRALAEAGADR